MRECLKSLRTRRRLLSGVVTQAEARTSAPRSCESTAAAAEESAQAHRAAAVRKKAREIVSDLGVFHTVSGTGGWTRQLCASVGCNAARFVVNAVSLGLWIQLAPPPKNSRTRR